MSPAVPPIIAKLQAAPVVDMETACEALGAGRTQAYARARERGEIVEGIRVIRVGRLYKCPSRPILSLLGYVDDADPASPGES